MTFYLVVDAIGNANDQCEDIKKDIFYMYMYLDSSVLFIYLMNAFL